ncbi:MULTISPECIES: GerMN domain-containing protein [Brevibacillus]|uniref:Spore gernimation protein n=1 Tax=Brevibacillus invocatus TaxID=173959 RepID=A0A3M8C3R0_9BACL|nr:MULTISPECIES: GerMN domain-containing protein [Brevibacillus]MCM3079269.1 GerMN domain-containing protein [Brevibacillus invocatus]MCM3429367.1 GerMN domain-containing protein [Brevibacillus invocatus]MDH4618331.1 GerMN domain-containing protein [Brevibacillus sp. AY1]RNB70328.1 spore gernimation protein [Brevibacillus invocatus]
MKNRRRLIGLAIFALVLVAGCGQQNATPAPTPTPAPQPNTSAEQPAGPELTKQTISVFYSDGDLLSLQEEKQEIAFADDLEKYKKAIATLEVPKDKEKHFPLWVDFKYHSLTFDKGRITIDSDGKNLYNLGSGGEGMALEALTKTLFQFPEVESIAILRDGEVVDSLMGHVEITEPFTRDQLENK